MDDELIFAEETEECVPTRDTKWKLLVVDDDEFVHKVTSMVLSDYRFEGHGLEIISAFPQRKARKFWSNRMISPSYYWMSSWKLPRQDWNWRTGFAMT